MTLKNQLRNYLARTLHNFTTDYLIRCYEEADIPTRAYIDQELPKLLKMITEKTGYGGMVMTKDK